MSEERASYNIEYTDAEEETTAEELLRAAIQEMIVDHDTRAWAHPVLIAAAEEDHTYPLTHLREDVRLLMRIIEGRDDEASAPVDRGGHRSRLDTLCPRDVPCGRGMVRSKSGGRRRREGGGAAYIQVRLRVV